MKNSIKQMVINGIYLLAVCVSAGNYVHGAAYIKFDGVEGESSDKNHDKWIDVLSYNFKVEVETDASTGMATGRKTYEPIIIRKRVDKASPKIFQYLATGKAMATAEIDFVEVAADGSEASVYKVSLRGVSSRVIRQYYPGDEGCPTETDALTEEIHLNFTEIEMSSPNSTETGTDVLQKNSADGGNIPVDFFFKDNVYGLSVSGSESYSTRLFNMNGKRVKSFRNELGSRAMSFSARNLQVNPGTYFVKIEMDSGETGVWPVTVK